MFLMSVVTAQPRSQRAVLAALQPTLTLTGYVVLVQAKASGKRKNGSSMEALNIGKHRERGRIYSND